MEYGGCFWWWWLGGCLLVMVVAGGIGGCDIFGGDAAMMTLLGIFNPTHCATS